MSSIICVNPECPEYLILKDNPGDPPVTPNTVCGWCQQPCEMDAGQGVDVADRPNPEEPLPLP